MIKDKILIIGANGQIGTVLTQALCQQYGVQQVVASDIRTPEYTEGIFELLDITNATQLATIVEQYRITQIYHLAAILSAKGESNPTFSWNVNMTGLLNVLEVARQYKVRKVFFPSSIAVFGGNTPRQNTPQETILNPTTVYGISKLAGEQWCNYYYKKYNLDIRSLRYPGIIGHESLPGGGTTDYAVEIYHYAVKDSPYQCFLKADARLPMIYMPDAIRATLQLMDAPADSLSIRTSYNLSAMSFTPAEITATIQQEIPDFQVSYQPDFRQEIAASWTESIDDSCARKDWNWKENYDLKAMTSDMLLHLREQYLVA